MKTIYKKITIYFLILLLTMRLVLPAVVLADDTPTDTPTPVPTDTVQTTDTPTPTDAPPITDTPAPTGTVSPTDTPTDTPTPTAEPTSSTDPSATPTDTPTDTATGATPTDAPTDTPSDSPTPVIDATNADTQTTTDAPTPTPAPCDSSITSCVGSTSTGNATATTQAENDINTTAVNSTSVNQTINIFLPQDGIIDLSNPSNIAANIVSSSNQDGQVFNISITSNNAYVNTNIISIANTGNNTSEGNGEYAIDTGNATSIVELVNKINLTLVNSQIHFITINIFGNLNGNIILPDISPAQNCSNCGATNSATIDNQATVTNTLGSNANTGTNSLTATNGSITTGNATAYVNLINIINQLIFGMTFNYLFINDFGTWNGNFLGWGDIPATTGGTSIQGGSILPNGDIATCPNCTTLTNATNSATVNNTISSLANTGGNTITTSGRGFIITGDANSIISLINLINSTFVNAKGFFAFINIFGIWNGDIGEASKFVKSDSVEAPSNGPSIKEDGGQLTVDETNNTGAYVLPGDTVTFFITVHNPGKGKVYDAKVHLALVKDGQEGGGTNFAIGDIDAGHSVKIITGLVLSTKASGGTYLARAFASGTTGEENTPLLAFADSTFTIYAPIWNNQNTQASQPKLPSKNVLAAHTPNFDNNNTDAWMITALLFIILGYLGIRLIREREHLLVAFARQQDFKQRLNSLRLFLL